MLKAKVSKILILSCVVFYGVQSLASVAYLKKPADQIVNEVICKKKIRSIINGWKVTNEFQKQLSFTSDKAITILSPTTNFGKWVKMDISPEEVELNLLSQNTMIHVKFDKNCNSKVSTTTRKTKLPRSYATDEDIYAQIKKNKTGLFYIWAPNMPLSVDGIKEIEAAAKETKIPVSIYLDPGASIKEAKLALKEKGLSSKYLKKYSSIEFDFRNARLHAPALVGYKNKKLLRHAKVGHEYKWKFVQYINEMVK